MSKIQGKEVSEQELEKSLDALSKGLLDVGKTIAKETGVARFIESASDPLKKKITNYTKPLVRKMGGVTKGEVAERWDAPKGARAINGGTYSIKGENGVERMRASHSYGGRVYLHTPEEDTRDPAKVHNMDFSHEEFNGEIKKSEKQEPSKIHLLAKPSPDWNAKRIFKSEDSDAMAESEEFLRDAVELEKSLQVLADAAMNMHHIVPAAVAQLHHTLSTLHPALHAAIAHISSMGIHPGVVADTAKEVGSKVGEGLASTKEALPEAANKIKEFKETTHGKVAETGALGVVGTGVGHAISTGISALKMRENKFAAKHNLHPSTIQISHYENSPAQHKHQYQTADRNFWRTTHATHTHVAMTHEPHEAGQKQLPTKYMTHEDFGKALDDKSLVHVPNSGPKEDVEKSEFISPEENLEVEVFTPMVNDKIIDRIGTTFILKSIDNGMYAMERDGRPTAALQEREYMRFINTPGTVIRRSGKRISL